MLKTKDVSVSFCIAFKKGINTPQQREEAILKMFDTCWVFNKKQAREVTCLLLECMDNKVRSIFDLKEEFCCESIDQLPEYFMSMYDAQMKIFEGKCKKKSKAAESLKSIDELLRGQDVILKVVNG